MTVKWIQLFEQCHSSFLGSPIREARSADVNGSTLKVSLTNGIAEA
jgi:hypothetical protein